MKFQQTVVLVKPDALQRGLTGEIISRFEHKGLKLVAIKMLPLTDKILDQWYAHHKDKSFFDDIKQYMQWTPVVAMLWEGIEAVPTVRKIVGTTKGREAEAGSIRGDFGMSQQNNLIHASENHTIANKERDLVFKKSEIFNYESAADALIYSAEERK